MFPAACNLRSLTVRVLSESFVSHLIPFSPSSLVPVDSHFKILNLSPSPKRETDLCEILTSLLNSYVPAGI